MFRALLFLRRMKPTLPSFLVDHPLFFTFEFVGDGLLGAMSLIFRTSVEDHDCS